MKKILISVLMPVFMADIRHLKIAAESILQQTYRNFELLVLYEGNKTDLCFPYLKSIADSRVKVLHFPMKTGLPKSLNAGIKAARGTYLARMDADDFSEPERFERQLDYMEKHREIDVLGCVCMDMSSHHLRFSKKVNPQVRKARMMFANAGVAHPSAFIRKRFLDEHGIWYNEKVQGSEDYHLWADIVIHGGNIDIIPEILLRYRVHDGQASQRFSKKMMQWDAQARQKQLSRYADFNKKEKAVFSDFNNPWLQDIHIQKTIALFEKLKQASREKADGEQILECEIAYQWIYKAVRSHNGKMLEIRNLHRIWVHGAFSYMISDVIKAVCGKVLPRIKYRQRG